MKRRNKYSLSYDKLLSCNAGYLVPIGLTEVLPGDTVQHATSLFCRLSPMVAPVMHPLHIKIHHWYVPFRLIWDEWEDFITGGSDGMDVSELPYMIATNSVSKPNGVLGDYLGIPPQLDATLQVSALPFRAYNLVYNEWYRWPALQDPLVMSTDSGLDNVTVTDLQRADWDKDYFTTATPSPQLGPSVSVPIDINNDGLSIVSTGDGKPLFTTAHAKLTAIATGNVGTFPAVGTGTDLAWDDPKLSVMFNSDIGAVNINSLREAFALQRFAEHRALFGSRYVEYLRYYGVRSSDARLQRPEYLGGGKQTVQMSEVLQTAEGDDPVGTLRGHGIAAMRSNRYRRFFEEHGYVLSLMQIVPKAIYAQGIPRLWLRQVREDFYQKELESIGEQEVYNAELYAVGNASRDVFGYQARYQEYRGQESTVSGEFRNLLDYWHMARIFTDQPVLNPSFLSADPTRRIFAEQTQDNYYCMIHHSMQARRIVTSLQTAKY